ncbi:hypothetical protein [Enhygromyxa salina]|uniref:hypothetical protein n=1 Tax=Enhygromyxa salina TaxID=215803 RepID=UPI0006976982|nr:hypothetical protein [Enhygromyxa salina]
MIESDPTPRCGVGHQSARSRCEVMQVGRERVTVAAEFEVEREQIGQRQAQRIGHRSDAAQGVGHARLQARDRGPRDTSPARKLGL